jgi:hypothetical protein
MNAKLTLNNKEYTVNFDKLLTLGVIEDYEEKAPNFHEIELFTHGDVYENSFGNVRVLIVSCDHDSKTFQIAGLKGLEPFSDFEKPVSFETILEFLNDGEYCFVKNINSEVEELINS